MITLRRFMPLLLALTLAACGGSGGSGGNSGTGSAQIASDPSALLNDNRPVHNVYFDAEGFAPFVMSDADNRPSGFGIELVQAIGDKQGFRPNFIPHSFSNMLQDVGKGKAQTSPSPRLPLPKSVKPSSILPTRTLKPRWVCLCPQTARLPPSAA